MRPRTANTAMRLRTELPFPACVRCSAWAGSAQRGTAGGPQTWSAEVTVRNVGVGTVNRPMPEDQAPGALPVAVSPNQRTGYENGQRDHEGQEASTLHSAPEGTGLTRDQDVEDQDDQQEDRVP